MTTRASVTTSAALARKRRQAAAHRKALQKMQQAMAEFKQTEFEYALLIYDDTKGRLDRFIAAVQAAQTATPGVVNYSPRKAAEDLFRIAKQHRAK